MQSTLASIHSPRTPLRILALFTAVFCLSLASLAQSPTPARKHEIWPWPGPMPIELVKVSNVESDHLFRDLTIEIKNVSAKPIYFMRLNVTLPDIILRQYPLGAMIYFGEQRLLRVHERPAVGALPLRPGETTILKFDEEKVDGFERMLAKGRFTPQQIKRVLITVTTISFGDGTGYQSGGVPYDVRSHTHSLSLLTPRGDGDSEGAQMMQVGYLTAGRDLSARLSQPTDLAALARTAQLGCCPNKCDGNFSEDECNSGCGGCCRNGAVRQSCDSPDSACSFVIFRDFPCGEFFCIESFTLPCGDRGPGPTLP